MSKTRIQGADVAVLLDAVIAASGRVLPGFGNDSAGFGCRWRFSKQNKRTDRPCHPSPTVSVTVQPKAMHPLLACKFKSPMMRLGVLHFVSEIIAGHASGALPAPLAKHERTGVLPIDLLKQNKKALKLAAYGFFISAPLGHTLMNILQNAFAGKTSGRAKLGMILCSNLFISPIQQSVYIAAMAYINGVESIEGIIKAWKMSIMPILRLTWVISTLSLMIAQRFLDPSTWVPFFTLVGATAGTFINTQQKKKALAARAKAATKRDAEKKD
ncbi:BZ3500_MvSof-1268-A1-R1_Chr1-3g02175 [Microbotryum saponariae]|uniref:BZ3500_MvSof-1268-A1-R1_Chr1-3g02175 protein n=1 Tax=Microbotryum saponariae TaxID=289078 RepID=A0A2X0LHN6_9BASI|nr:BZ3500_MvSof-1268-A1-R1_Chr1-3g02175 [Microbotryum saponariae]SCZ95573.1 BZ3501_MvSof-1269-A2-R1_Chr1-3g01778 [Microbotryum saponariae]